MFCLLLPLGLWADCDSTGVSASYRSRDLPLLLKLAKAPGLCPDSQALAWHLAGVVYGRRNLLDSAIYCMRQAQSMREALAAGTYSLDLGKSNFNLGLYHKRLGQYRLAKPYLERACEVYSQLDYPSRLFTAYLQLSQVYTEIGDLQRADDLCNMAIQLARTENSEELLAKAYLDYGYFWVARDQPVKALQYLQQAHTLFQKQDLNIDAVNCLQMLASTLADQGEFAAAENYYRQVLAIYEQMDACTEWAIACNNLASVLITQGKHQAARPLIERATGIARGCQATQVLAQSADLRGEADLLGGDALAAARAFQQAQQYLLPSYQPTEITELPSAEKLRYLPNQLDYFVYLKDHIRALEIAYEHTADEKLVDAIHQAYARADQLVDFIRENHLGQSTRLFWRKRVLPFYEQAVAFCARRQQASKAFHFFEKSKAILLLESMVTNDALSEVPPALQQREALWQAKLMNLLQEPERGHAQRLRLQSALEHLRDSLRRHFPRYAAAQVQSAIPDADFFVTTHLSRPDACWVHYLFGAQAVYALVGQQGQWQLHDLGSAAMINQILSGVLSYFATADRIDRDPQGYLRAAYRAYTVLLAPLNLPNSGSLTIVPDGPLAYLPFAALVRD
ncbi:MAG: tetratricopeptide repeat protein, partial [Bacteroidetes bacterium]